MWIVVALLAAGCGSTSNASSSAGHSASAHTLSSRTAASADQPFTVKAEVICERVNDAIAAAKPASNGVREIERIVPRRVALELASAGELSRLTAPASVAGAWRKMLAYRRKLAHELAELVSAAKRNDLAAIRALTASKQRVHHQLFLTATAAGFKMCARVG